MEEQKKYKVLVVEDDVSLAKALTIKLTDIGMEVVSAENGEIALRKLETFTPDIILLDVIMPIMGGFEVLKKLKTSEEYKNIPVVMLTNINQRSNIDEAIANGADDYFVKVNYSMEELIKKISIIIEKNK